MPTDYPPCPASSRDYRPAEGAALYAIWLTRQHTTPPSMTEAEFCAHLAQAWVRVACLPDEQIVGFAAIELPGVVVELVTAAAHERQGVASLLLEDLNFLAAAMGAASIKLEVPEAAEAAKAFFLRRGYVSKLASKPLNLEKPVAPLG